MRCFLTEPIRIACDREGAGGSKQAVFGGGFGSEGWTPGYICTLRKVLLEACWAPHL
jgi:hypothetical protein